MSNNPDTQVEPPVGIATEATTWRQADLSMAAVPQRRWLGLVLSFVQRKPMGAMGAFIIIVMVLMALLADVIAPYDAYELRIDRQFVEPGSEFWFGTDEYGRDLFTRVLYGSRTSLLVGFLAVALGTTTGSVLGLVSGYFGGRIDTVIQRVMDSMMAIPTLVLALAIIAGFGRSRINVILAIAIVLIPTASRVIRSSVLSVRQHAYVEAAQSIGCPNHRILFIHIMPNCMAPYLIIATVALGGAILSEASLSFLGLGTPPPEPSWGEMLSGAAQKYVRQAPWMGIFPGIAISLAVFGFNMLGDGLRDFLDPRLRSR